MAVETSVRKQTFTGGQSSLTFSFRTLIGYPQYIKVKLVETSTEIETDLTYSTDFTVSVNSDGIGGIVTVSPSYSTAYNYVVYRDTDAIQPSDYDDFNQFPADTLENDLDRNILINQEQKEELTRTLRYPISISGASTELPVPEADSFIGWNASGDALENKALPDPNTLQKATNTDATTGTNDTNYMTPAKVKLQVENAGSVLIPQGNYVPPTTTSTTAIVALCWPVGSIFISTSATNPATLLGIGTWTAFGAGRVLVGYNAGDSDFNTLEGTGGAKTVDLSHDHGGYTGGVSFTGATGSNTAGPLDTQHRHTISSALSSSTSVVQPYITVNMWKRTA